MLQLPCEWFGTTKNAIMSPTGLIESPNSLISVYQQLPMLRCNIRFDRKEAFFLGAHFIVFAWINLRHVFNQ
jgi:hypothetical protein